MKKFFSIIFMLSILLTSTVTYAAHHNELVTFGNKSYWLEGAFYYNSWEKDEETVKNEQREMKGEKKSFELWFFSGVPQSHSVYPENVFIPSKIELDYPIYKMNIGYSGEHQNGIKNIIIENGIKNISLLSLNSFPNLKQVIVPESVEQITLEGSEKYYQCKDYYEVNQEINWSEYFGVPIKEIFNVPYQLPNGEIVYNAAPEYQKIMDELYNEHEENEEKICARESNNVITFYAKSNSYAEKYLKNYGLNVQSYVSVKYNNKEIYSDQPAVIVNGRTLVPLRAIFESMDATVEWDGDTKTVKSNRKNTNISLQVGSNELYVNGNAKKIDVPATLINGRTMVPARAVAEAFGCKVEWINETRTVLITE